MVTQTLRNLRRSRSWMVRYTRPAGTSDRCRALFRLSFELPNGGVFFTGRKDMDPLGGDVRCVMHASTQACLKGQAHLAVSAARTLHQGFHPRKRTIGIREIMSFAEEISPVISSCKRMLWRNPQKRVLLCRATLRVSTGRATVSPIITLWLFKLLN